MKIYITSQHEQTLSLWRRTLPNDPEIEFALNSDGAIQADVLVMSGVWAFDRYGGKPDHTAAQVRENVRGDGLPDWIIVPPFRPTIERDGIIEIRADFKNVSPSYYAIFESLKTARHSFGDSCTVILDLLMLGMDDWNDTSTPTSVGRAIQDFRES